MKKKQIFATLIATMCCVGITSVPSIAVDTVANNETAPSLVMGDVNGDGSFGVSDVVLFQKWLLAVQNTELTNWKAVDYNQDNKLDVFDLTLMKCALIQNPRISIACKSQSYAIAGKTFVYEKEGMGGRFTISFNEDGTYSYYEGDLSSYIGSGSWVITDDIVVLSENIRGNVIRLKLQDGVLTYIDDGSKNFYYIKVKNGEKFYLYEENNSTDESMLYGKTFVYEKEGMGGRFTISFNEDDTYSYYEGDLSSYIGSGSWMITDDIVVLSENIRDNVIRLKLQDGVLTYIDDGSKNFYYIKVKDGEKFYLYEEKNSTDEPMLDGKTFVYEKEGMGGEFTISFNEDGTYSYYEGNLSSYVGSGTWKIYDDTVILTEHLKNTIIRLKIQADALVYSAEDSDNFYYIKVNDGERFNLSE